MNWKIEKLMNGETIISKEPGNSMLPLIKSKQPVKLAPITWDKVEVGDIVYCKVKRAIHNKTSPQQPPQGGQSWLIFVNESRD